MTVADFDPCVDLECRRYWVLLLDNVLGYVPGVMAALNAALGAQSFSSGGVEPLHRIRSLEYCGFRSEGFLRLLPGGQSKSPASCLKAFESQDE